MMKVSVEPGLSKSIAVLFLFFLIIAGLYFSKEFLVPVTIAGMLSMLLLPLQRRLQRKGIGKGFAIFLCIFSLLLLIAGIFTLIFWQVTELASDLDKIEKHVTELLDKGKNFISNSLGISAKQQGKIVEEQQKSASSGGMSVLSTIAGSISSILVNFILVVVYIFLFMYFRVHLRNFILKLVPDTAIENTRNILSESSKVIQKYLGGLGMMIVCLWIMYGIGYSIIGVENALFFAVLCGLLEIVPFVGNLTGTSLTVLMVVAQGGNGSMIAAVLCTYAVIQGIQSYLLEPLIVGAEVDINPLFTIIIIVVAEMVWGVPGMILAIPLLGIVKIICDRVEGLKPYGFLIGKEKEDEGGGIGEKLKKLFSKKS
jgi:predicted PurR-regulated permease PerM